MDIGDRSGVRGMLTGRMTGWMGCREDGEKKNIVDIDIHVMQTEITISQTFSLVIIM